jgi:hypothetical protein
VPESLQRFRSSASPCPICGGSDRDPRGKGRRCWGFSGSDGEYAHCTNELFAGDLPLHVGKNGGESYAHKLHGRCNCGSEHGPAKPPLQPAMQNGAGRSIPTPSLVASDWVDGAGAEDLASAAWEGESPATSPHPSDADDTPPRQIVASYVYTDTAGHPLIRVRRWEGAGQKKTFDQQHWNGSAWVGGAKAMPQVLYRARELAQRPPGTPVFFCEGEKDADALAALGLCATTNLGGSKGPARIADESVELLRGADVILVRDKDAQGLVHEAGVRKRIGGVVKSLRVVEARSGKDASDHLAAGHTVEEFVRIPETPLELALANSTVDAFLGSEPEPLRWVIENLIPEGDTGLLVGSGGVGKGHLIQQLALAIATGFPFGPFRVPERSGVLYCSWEDDRRELHRRFQAATRALWLRHVPEDEAEYLRRYLHIADLVGVQIKLGSELGDALAHRTRQIENCKTIILDPLAHMLPADMPGSLNTQEGAGHVHALANQIRKATGCSVILVHHVSKDAKKAGKEMTDTAATGSQQLVDLARFVINVRAMDSADVVERGLGAGTYVEVGTSKTNRGPGMVDSAVWRRASGGGLVYTPTRTRDSVALDQAVEALVPIQPATRDAWDAACKAQFGLGVNRARILRGQLLSAGRVERVAGPTRPSGRATELYVVDKNIR